MTFLREFLSRRGAAIAAAGALMASLGDLGQLWVVNAARPELQLAVPPPGIIVLGTLFGAFGLPLYGAGYCARALAARDASNARKVALAISGIAFAVLGGTVHATTGALIAHDPGGIADGLDPLQGILRSGPIVLSLWAAATATFVAASIAEFRIATSRREWVYNPLVLTLILLALAPALTAPWGDFVGPASVNLAHLVFFLRWTRAA